MTHIAKIFTNGRSQAVRLPAIYRFDSDEVFIYRDPETGNVILSRKPENWDGLLALLQNTKAPEDFLSKSERKQKNDGKDPFENWEE